MATDLAELVPALKRAVAVPGTFATLFPDTIDADLEATLLDGFAEAQLDGLLSDLTADDNAVVTPALTRAQGALVVLYGSVRILLNEIRNRKTHTRYEASGSVFEQDQAATMLVQLLKDYQQQKKDVKEALRRGSVASAFSMVDAYWLRAVGGDYGSGRQGA